MWTPPHPLPLAEQAYRKVISRYPGKPVTAGAVGSLAEVYVRTDRATEAISLCRSFALTSADDPALVQHAVRRLAELLTNSRGHAGALAGLQEFAKTVGSGKPLLLAELRLAIAASYAGQDNRKAAVEELHGLLASLPAESPIRVRAINQLAANIILGIEEDDETIRMRILDEGPIPLEGLSYDAVILIASAYAERGDYSLASQTIRRFIARFPDHRDVGWMRLSLADFELKQGNQLSSIRTLREVLRYHSGEEVSGQARLQLGELYRKDGYTQAALREYRRVALESGSIPSSRALAYLRIGDILRFDFRDYRGALEAYQQAAKFADPESGLASTVLQRVTTTIQEGGL